MWNEGEHQKDVREGVGGQGGGGGRRGEGGEGGEGEEGGEGGEGRLVGGEGSATEFKRTGSTVLGWEGGGAGSVWRNGLEFRDWGLGCNGLEFRD